MVKRCHVENLDYFQKYFFSKMYNSAPKCLTIVLNRSKDAGFYPLKHVKISKIKKMVFFEIEFL